MARVIIPGFRKIETNGGAGTTDYNELDNIPSINNVPLVGNMKTSDLHLMDYGVLTLSYEDANTLKGSINLDREIKSAIVSLVVKSDSAYKNVNILALNVASKVLTVQALGMNFQEDDKVTVSYIAVE